MEVVKNRIQEAAGISAMHAEIAYETVKRERLARLLQSGTVITVKPLDPLRVEALRRSLMVYSLWRMAQVVDVKAGDADALHDALHRRLPPRPEILAGFRVAGVAPALYVPPASAEQYAPDESSIQTIFGEPLESMTAIQEFTLLAGAAGYPPPPSTSSSPVWVEAVADIVRQGTPVCVISIDYEDFTFSEYETRTSAGAKRASVTPLMSLIQALADAPPVVRRHSTVLLFMPEDRILKSSLEASMVSEVAVYPRLAEYRAVLRRYGVRDLDRAARTVRGLLLFQVQALPGLERGVVDPHEAARRKRTGDATEIVEAQGGFDEYVFPEELINYVRRILVRPLQERDDELGRVLAVVGPTGSGRRTLVKAVAYETGLPLLRVRMEKLFGKYVGETEKNMAAALRDANRIGGILMFANVDSTLISSNRAFSTNELSERIVGMLMEELVKPDRRFVAAFTIENAVELPPSFKQLMNDVNVVLFFLDHSMRVKMLKYYLSKLPVGYSVNDEDLEGVADHYMLALSTPRDIKSLVSTASYLSAGEPVRLEHLVAALDYHWSTGEDKLRFLDMFEDIVKSVPSYLPLIDRYMKNLRKIREAARIYQRETRRILAEAMFSD